MVRFNFKLFRPDFCHRIYFNAIQYESFEYFGKSWQEYYEGILVWDSMDGDLESSLTFLIMIMCACFQTSGKYSSRTQPLNI